MADLCLEYYPLGRIQKAQLGHSLLELLTIPQYALSLSKALVIGVSISLRYITSRDPRKLIRRSWTTGESK